MKLCRESRKTANLSDSVLHCINMYALMASAAGVGMVSVQPAQAKIVYTPTHRTLTNGTLPIPLDGTHDFTLSEDLTDALAKSARWASKQREQ